MAGQRRILLAGMARGGNPKGGALKSAIKSTFSAKNINSVNGKETQPVKKGKK